MADDVDRRVRLRQMFREWGKDGQESALYSAISAKVAQSDDILALYDGLPLNKCRTVLLFASVRYLLLAGVDANSKLGQIYQAPEARGALELAGTAFSMYVDDHWDDVAALMATRSVQTNEVNRSAALVPALMEIYRQTHQPLSLIEIGASAGLNLLFDRYRYDYGNGNVLGPPGATVRCHMKLQGALQPRFDQALPPVETRIGIDLEPIDLRDEQQTRWLEACVWADDLARIQRLEAAIALAKREWPDVREGDAVKVLQRIANGTPDESALVIFNSWTMAWMSDSQRRALDAAIVDLAGRRPVWWLTYEWANKVPGLLDVVGDATSGSVLGLQRLDGDERRATVLARVADHGQWIEWLDAQTAAG